MFTEERRVQVLRVQALVIIEGEIGIERELRSKVLPEAEVALVRRHREVIVRVIPGQVGQETWLLHPVKSR